MASAVHYFATSSDQSELLDYIGEPATASLHPWPIVTSPPIALTREEALQRSQVMVVNRDCGPTVVVRAGDPAMEEQTKSGLFNRLNWARARPSGAEGLIDSNRSPVLLWTPGKTIGAAILVSSIGSQADDMRTISSDYERWVNRVMAWIRRRGTKVWGIERSEVSPHLDVDLSFLNNVYALPGALEAMKRGTPGRA